MLKTLLTGVFLLITSYFISSGNQKNNIEVKEINRSTLSNIIKNRNGKPLVINVWATWCVPCREEMPDLIKIQNNFKHIEVIGISADYPDEIKSKIIPFLRKQKVNFRNYVNSFKPDTELIDFLNKDWNGALPATFIYDSSGKQIAFLDGKQTYEHFEKQLIKLSEL